jgi:hypothetical protein
MKKTKDNSKIATEEYLDKRLKILKVEIIEELDERLEEVDKHNKTYKDQVFNKLDHIVGQLENLRIDNEVGANQTSELWDKADDHEKRIATLEQRQVA